MTTTLPGATIPPQAPRRRAWGALVIAALVAILLAAGVAVALSSRGGSDSGRISALDGPDGTKPKTEVEKVEEAYRNFRLADRRASEIPDPSSPLLAVYSTGPQLKAAVDAIEKLRRDGQATQQVPNSIGRTTVKVLSVEGDKARLTECSVSDGIVVRVDTRKPAYEYPPGFATTSLFIADMVRENGSWKAWSITREQRWEGVAGCAVVQS